MDEAFIEPSLTDAVLSALWRSARARRAATAPATIERLGAQIRPRQASASELEQALASLVAQGAVRPEGDGFSLQEAAAPRAREAHHEVSQAYFGQWLVRMEDSAASHAFCARVYDTGLLHFNMLDAAQLQAAEAALAAGSGGERQLVDLGCATGALTEHLARVTGARVHGVDFARAAIARARRRTAPGLSFEVGRLDDWTPAPASLDGAVLFDSVYFVDDLPRLLGALLRGLRPGGRIVAFVSAHVTDEEPLTLLAPDQTAFGQALGALGARYTVRDFLPQTHAMWRRSQAAVEAMEGAFTAEGSRDLWEARRDETAAILARHDAGRSCRWMYAVEGE